MFLNRVKIENFRGFRRINVAFEETTVLIAENNYGKTSLLDALRICLGNPGDGAVFPFAATDFRVASDDGTEPDPIKITVTLRERRKKQWKHARGTPLKPLIQRGPRGLKQIVLRVVATPDPSADRPRVEWLFVNRAGERIGKPDDPATLRELRRWSPFLHIRDEAFHVEAAKATPPPRGKKGSRRRLELQVEAAYRALSTSRAPVAEEQLARGVEAADRLLERAADRFRLESPRRLFDTMVQTPIPLALGERRARTGSAGLQALGRLLLYGAVLDARGEEQIAADAHPILALEEPEAHQHPRMLASMWAVLHEFPAQKIVTTNSSELLAAVPLRSVRRLMRRRGSIEAFRPGNNLTVDEVRRISYHIRVRRGDVLFARCWLLIEGETEFWLMPELARLLGYEFPTEGVRCVEFAQSGAAPLVKLARDLGIEWHLLTDGDAAGKRYAETARQFVGRRERERDRITQLREPDIERCLWEHGYADVYRNIVGVRPPGGGKRRRDRPAAVIERAERLRSKPSLALSVVEAAAAPKSPGVPPILQRLIETVVRLARTCTR